jgi:hypothetical protein
MIKTEKKAGATTRASSMTWTGRMVFLPAIGAMMGKSVSGFPVIIPPWLTIMEHRYDLDVGEYPSCILLRRKLTGSELIILTDTMNRNRWFYCEARKPFLKQGEIL